MKFKLKKDAGWEKYRKAIETLASNSQGFKKAIGRAAGIVGQLGIKEVRNAIKKGSYEKNAELTAAIKGSSSPLRGTAAGGLFQAITSQVQSWDRVFVGVLRTSQQYNIAAIVHNGAVVPVTDKMRGLFAALARASEGANITLGERAAYLFSKYQEWTGLRSTTTSIVIPARPFFKVAFENENFQRSIIEKWISLLEKAIREVAA